MATTLTQMIVYMVEGLRTCKSSRAKFEVLGAHAFMEACKQAAAHANLNDESPAIEVARVICACFEELESL